MAVDNKVLDWEALVRVKAVKFPIWDRIGHEAKVGEDGTIETSAGRLVFNEELPPEIPFINYEMKDKELRALIEYVFNEKGSWITVKMLDAIKYTGYRYATVFGATIGIDDIVVPKEKADMIDKANKEVEAIQTQWRQGLMTQGERVNKVIEV